MLLWASMLRVEPQGRPAAPSPPARDRAEVREPQACCALASRGLGHQRSPAAMSFVTRSPGRRAPAAASSGVPGSRRSQRSPISSDDCGPNWTRAGGRPDPAGSRPSCRRRTHRHARALGERHRRRVAVLVLPVKVPVLDPDERLDAAIGKRGGGLHLGREVVRMRIDAEHFDVDRQDERIVDVDVWRRLGYRSSSIRA